MTNEQERQLLIENQELRTQLQAAGGAPIPERYAAFFREVARLAKDADFREFEMTVRPGHSDLIWYQDVKANWSQGRHGAMADGVAITSTVTVRQSILSENNPVLPPL